LKIAYLIAAHNNYEHLKRLVSALNEGECRFYIHIDKKFSLPDLKGDNIIYLKERVNVHWSGFSIVRLTLQLLQRAISDENDYYAFISGSDYPIHPNEFLFEKLNEGGEYITIKEGCDTYNPLSRYKYYYFTDFYNRRDKGKLKTKFFLWLQKKLRDLKVRKKIPFQLYTGTQWFVLSKACVQYILQQVKEDKKYVRFFRTAFCSDEGFFQTIIGNSPFYYQTKNNLTYADWSVDPGPAIINQHHIPILKNFTDKFFARKFNDASADIVQIIDMELRSKLKHTIREENVSKDFRTDTLS